MLTGSEKHREQYDAPQPRTVLYLNGQPIPRGGVIVSVLPQMVIALNSNTVNELHSRRSDLKHEGRFAEAIPIQQEILKHAQQSRRVLDVSNAWNLLSHLLQANGQLSEAEEAARQALSTYANESLPRLETLATYEMKLALILAEQGRFEEAVPVGELAIKHFSDFHDQQSDFLKARKDDVGSMKLHRDATKGNHD